MALLTQVSLDTQLRHYSLDVVKRISVIQPLNEAHCSTWITPVEFLKTGDDL